MKTKYLMKHLIGTLVFFAILFVAAGRIDYWQGLLYTGSGLIMFFLSQTIWKIDDNLAAEREKPGQGTKSWDKKILGLSLFSTLGVYTIAGLDSGRFNWSSEFHWSLYLAGFVVTTAGQVLFLMAQKENKYFSSTVRIQTDRNHQVCNTGLYRFVRHPAYFGNLIQSIALPFFFGSWWSFIPAGFSALLTIIRTGLEDKTLQEELIGYQEYSQQIKWKLIRGIW